MWKKGNLVVTFEKGRAGSVANSHYLKVYSEDVPRREVTQAPIMCFPAIYDSVDSSLLST